MIDKRFRLLLLALLMPTLLWAQTPEQLKQVPEWAQKAIWYQIFVERFRNGDAANDPQFESMLDAMNREQTPKGWKVTPWTQDWYKPDPWFNTFADTSMNFSSRVQWRRYGGDLQGVLDKLDYLQELGVTALYFNPLNDAPSAHKYDPAYWHHIDRHFGPDPKGDAAKMQAEDAANPAAWTWTKADSLFLEVVKQAHQRGMRVIMDYSWNHTGTNFWAFKDVAKKGQASAHKDWYIVKQFDDPATPQSEFDYQGWINLKYLPEIKENVNHPHDVMEAYEGNLAAESAKQHIYAVAKRWADPNGDGDTSDGIDGMRLDVAAELPVGFWRDFRKSVRAVNPDFYLIGEVWWEKWPDDLLDPRPFVKGDVFDAHMNYRWFRAARHFFNDAPDQLPVTTFVRQLDSIFTTVRPEVARSYMNMSSSHDSPRLATTMFNKNKYKFNETPMGDASYKIHKPDAEARRVQEQFLLHQYTFMGSPQIWNGDEMGMWGSDDPDTRKPLIWKDYQFEDETTHPRMQQRPTDKVRFDDALFAYYKQLTALRKAQPELAMGDTRYLLADDARRLLAYARSLPERETVVAFNRLDQPQQVTLPVRYKRYKDPLTGKTYKAKNGQVTVALPAQGSAVLVKVQ